MKKIVILLLAAVLIFSVAGCNNQAVNTGEVQSSEEVQELDETNEENATDAPIEYPVKNVQVYVGASAGGGTDTLTRIIMAKMEEDLGVAFAVVNKPGASGSLSNLELSQAKPDGYTIGVFTDFETIGNLVSGEDLGYTKDDFEYIASVNVNTNALMLAANFPGEKTFEGFIDYAKEHPGEVTVGTTSGAQRIVLASLCEAAGIEITTVAFNGGSESFNNLLGGHIYCSFISPKFGDEAIANGCSVVAVASDNRFSLLPDVPTFKEFGYDVINNEVTRIFVAPKGTPEEIINILADEMEQIASTMEFAETLKGSNEMVKFVRGQE